MSKPILLKLGFQDVGQVHLFVDTITDRRHAPESRPGTPSAEPAPSPGRVLGNDP
jgi:hypothetical protein